MNKTETGEIRRSNVRARMYQPSTMLVHGIASMPAKNAGALIAVSGIEDAVPLIHGPAGCEPKILRDPTPEGEMRLSKDLGIKLVLSSGGIARYNAEGVRDFNGTAFFVPMSHSLV